MKEKIVGMLIALALLDARASAELAKSKNCMACHAVNSKLVGPALKDVATKYRGDKAAVDKLTQKVLKGSTGTWGAIPMPPNSQVSEAEARTLVSWVLKQQ